METNFDLVSVLGSKLNRFLRAGSKLTWFYRRDRTRLAFCAGVKLDFGYVGGPTITWF